MITRSICRSLVSSSSRKSVQNGQGGCQATSPRGERHLRPGWPCLRDVRPHRHMEGNDIRSVPRAGTREGVLRVVHQSTAGICQVTVAISSVNDDNVRRILRLCSSTSRRPSLRQNVRGWSGRGHGTRPLRIHLMKGTGATVHEIPCSPVR